jgi:DNA-binding MarR family transcriptional regulator
VSGEVEDEMHRLEESFRQVNRRIASEWNKDNFQGISMTQSRILIRLDEAGPQMASALADLLGITSGAVTGIADKLLELGHIKRERGEKDRRTVLLDITDSGREQVKMALERRKAIVQMVFTGLDRDEIRQLTAIYERILDNINRQEKG